MADKLTGSGAAAGPKIDIVTVASLAATVGIVAAAYGLSLRALPGKVGGKLRTLFIWHAADGICHLTLELSFLYNCFFTYATNTALSPAARQSALYMPPVTPEGVHFLGYSDRLYGSVYGKNPMALLWQEYARADRRWGGADLTLICLEVLTVFGEGPLCLLVCQMLGKHGGMTGKIWFWAIIIAVGEIYGGWMTFGPEWLSGSPNLDTSNWMYTYLYLFFFNFLWVVFPVWVLYEAYQVLATVDSKGAVKAASKKRN